jgi:hypothetical protein
MTEFAHPSVADSTPRLHLVTTAAPGATVISVERPRAYPGHGASSARALCALDRLFRAADLILERALGVAGRAGSAAPGPHADAAADAPRLRLVPPRSQE